MGAGFAIPASDDCRRKHVYVYPDSLGAARVVTVLQEAVQRSQLQHSTEDLTKRMATDGPSSCWQLNFMHEDLPALPHQVCHRVFNRTGGFNDDVVEAASVHKLADRNHQITAHCAAQAAVLKNGQLYILWPRIQLTVLAKVLLGFNQGVVNGNVPKLILNHCDLLTMVFRQDVVQQRCLA